jgi:tetratricopeptide (TPR) repeat protein
LYKLDKAIEMMPGNDEAYMWRGWVSRRAGLWEQAAQSMQQALKLNPRVHFSWHEYALTLMYLHRYEEAMSAVKQSRVIDPDSFWGKTTQAYIVLQESGDTQSALQLIIGAQHGDYDFFEAYMFVNMLARRFDEALAAARNLPDDLEVRRGVITLREDWAAQSLHYAGKLDEAKLAAGAALFRLKGLRTELCEDYRIDIAEARILALQGAGPDEVRTLVKKSVSQLPADSVDAFQLKLIFAKIFGIAGMVSEAIELLEPLFQPPSDLSVHLVELDPAFDGIRDDPEFTAMMERNR